MDLNKLELPMPWSVGGRGATPSGSTDPHSVPPAHGSVCFILTHQAGSKAVVWPGSHAILPLLWLYLVSQGWAEPGLGDRASSNVVFALWFSISYAELLSHQRPFYHRENPLRPLWMGLSLLCTAKSPAK